MEKASDIAVVVLGAGAGKRFGSGDKLNQKLADKPVAHYILDSLAPFQWGRKILVHHGKAPWHDAFIANGFVLAPVAQLTGGMLGSIHNGLTQVIYERHVLLCLADMPLVSVPHLTGLLALFRASNRAIVASRSPNFRGPPAIIPLARLELLPKTGEGGVRALLNEARFLDADDQQFADIDTAGDLEKIRIFHEQPGSAALVAGIGSG
ncbi:NTP transferase domain-containing protein [Brucella cytisi]|uniref:MobA-like NTP transferase domain-containing protein n=1 Tax=Brucella cytisi TaxID=407152 RepID=A0A1J6HK27_9HYPH|nr:NTP transferase domain-containing protein [Brucella cytisi]OIS92841.1 hypothetical protein BLA27_14220 [Brucella cytisi]